MSQSLAEYSLREAANEHMAILGKTPERVIGYVQNRRVRYAAGYFIGPNQSLR